MNQDIARVAIVTGAGGMRGIGRAIALRFAQAGLDIALVDIERDPARTPQAELDAGWQGIASVADEVRALGRRAVCICADISRTEDVDRICRETLAGLGSIDVLVNNARAGIGRDRVPVADLDIAEWDRVMAVNARGTLLLSQAVARYFIAQGVRGNILNMSSLSSKRGMALHACYSMSKFAVNSLTQVLARELGPHGIRVNAMCPGWVDTGRFSLGEKLAAEKAGTSAEEQHRAELQRQARMNALGRIPVAEDVAGLAAFLISDEARHITGQAINVDGGESYH